MVRPTSGSKRHGTLAKPRQTRFSAACRSHRACWHCLGRHGARSLQRGEGAERLVPALGTVLCEVVIGTAICVLAGFCTTPNSFFVALAFGVLFMFMTTAGVNVALMWSVPPANRTTAMALSVIIIHLIGDVPSPIVIGEIDRTSTPKMTFLLTSSWLFWAIFCWCAALVLARLKVKRIRR